ncbi:hydroxymethylglutaryl-CoA synthase [Streptomyces formicae]|uniref:Hydroxymethylglutaryl-CoA synthase n=1 Tax=Streptomyces formicae TaxID=1616117 RepID=A0A291Q1L4_9ACTN|nr:hydroxymethylglutaryl-CoA synthase [Streptomyces formicae]ATL25620.1 Hydroxymethylglutaryl-CoA synthase [Streptomyces formicae]
MTNDRAVGIHDLSFRTGSLVLTHAELSKHTGASVAKYHKGLGQQAMSLPAADEDIVTMAADAAAPIIERHGTDRICTLLFATETSIDQSKAAGVYVHSLLNLPSNIRVVELKQACYGATAALQFAAALVQREPEQQVLVLASDIACYDLDSPGEATQGAAAVAMLVSVDPSLVEINTPSGLYTHDVMDFWRPNYRATALVNGKKSMAAYLAAVEGAWHDYQAREGLSIEKIRTVCYHQPFTRMAFKAHRHLLDTAGVEADATATDHAIAPTTHYNEIIGNSYTASLYLALASLLDAEDELDAETLGFFSYGSGSVAEFFTGRVVPGYRAQLRTTAHLEAISRRRDIDYNAYRRVHTQPLPDDGSQHRLPHQTQGSFRLSGMEDHQRIYEAVHVSADIACSKGTHRRLTPTV